MSLSSQSPRNKSYDIVIIGGGIMGASTALFWLLNVTRHILLRQRLI